MTLSPDLSAYIDALPKAELHLHIEGTFEPELMMQLAGRNGVSLSYGTVEELRAAYDFDDLQSFLDLYYQGMSALVTEPDFFDLTRAYLDRAHVDNVRHTEIFFDPQAHLERGVSFETALNGIQRALEDAHAAYGMSYRIIMCFLRHLDADDAMRTLELALPHRDLIAGVGLDSSEVGHPPEKFTAVFDRARAEGFLTVAHAGEEGPPAYVSGALDSLGVSRIDHGVRSIEDPELVRRLAAMRMPLTLCPLSNLRLKVFGDLADYPLRDMMAAGLVTTINSDDPAYFGGYVNDNYRAVAEALDLDASDLAHLARNSIRASFLDADAKAALIAEIDTVPAP